MSTGGLSQARLGRMHAVLAGYVERGALPGLVTLVSRRGEVRVDTFGTLAFDSNVPMRRDTIFRIASMTKPITAVAALILVEECKLRLDDPVDALLPELADRRVLRRLDGPLADTVPANRPISLRDLLTLRMGFGHIMDDPSRYPIMQAAHERQLLLGPPQPRITPTPDEWLRRVGTLPLMHQPGERWMYDLGLDVLGVLVARAAGQPFDVFLRERIFEPLGMHDTAFSVPAAKSDRLAASYWTNFATGAFELFDPAEESAWSQPPAFPSGGGGLVSTIDDYLAFGRMLLNKGNHENARILSRPTVELMTMNHLTPQQREESGVILDAHLGWGFGLGVVIERDTLSAVPDRYGWDGGLGTSWSNDPAEDLVAIMLTQRAMGEAISHALYQDFWTSVYQAIDD